MPIRRSSANMQRCRIAFVRIAVTFGVVATLSSCRPSRDGGVMDLRARGRELTHNLLAGTFESLPANAVLDLGGAGDTVLVRWFIGQQRASLGREWPASPLLTLEGLQAGRCV